MKELENTVKERVYAIIEQLFNECEEAENENRYPSQAKVMKKITPLMRDIDLAFVMARERIEKKNKSIWGR